MAITYNSTFDIVGFIENNPLAKLGSSYQNILINKIKDNFNSEQQQMFVGSFYCFLKFNSTSDFIINFEDVWKWCGFTRKDHAKRILEKHFKIDTEYKVEKAAPPIGGAGTNSGAKKSPPNKDEEKTAPAIAGAGTNGGAGHNKEKILMTINTFKKYCLRADTNKASEIHEYYIKLEEILQQTLMEQTEELQKQLKEEKKMTEEHEEKIKKMTEKYVKQKRPVYQDENVVYIMTSDDSEPQRLYAVGKTTDLNVRLAGYNQNKIHQFRVVYYRACRSVQLMNTIETCFLLKLDEYRTKASRDVFHLPVGKEISMFTEILDYLVDTVFKDVSSDVKLEDRSEEEKKESRQERIPENYYKNYYQENKEELQSRMSEYYQENKEKIKENVKKYTEDNKEKTKESRKKYREEHKDEIKKYFVENKTELCSKKREHYKSTKALVECPCGMIIINYNTKRHSDTAFHKKFLETGIKIQRKAKKTRSTILP